MPGEEFDGQPLDPYAAPVPLDPYGQPAAFGPQLPPPEDTSGYKPWDWLGDPSGGAPPPVTPPEGPVAGQLDGGAPTSPPIAPAVDPSLLAAPPAPDMGAGPPPFPGPPDVALPAGPPPAPPLPAGPDIGAPPAPFGPTYDVSHLPGVSIRPETHADQYTGHPWDNPVAGERDAAAESMAINDPVGFQRYTQHLAESKEATRAAQQAQADRDNLETLQRDIADRQKADAAAQAKSDAITADAIKLAGTKTDPDRYMNNRSNGQRITDILVAALGGLIAGRTGGPNVGLQMVQKRIDQDIDAQRQDIETGKASIGLRQSAVAQEYQRTGNLYQAAETVRQATYTAAINQLQTDQQNYDPRGTSFRDRGLLIQGLVGRQTQAAEAARKEMHAEALANIKEEREQQDALERRRHNKAEEALAWTREGREAAKDKADNTFLTPAQIHQQFPNLPTEAIPPAGGTVAQLGKHIDVYNKGLETQGKTVAQSAEERSRQFGVGEITDDQGAPVLFRDVAAAGKVTEAKAAADAGVGLIDKLLVARQKYGWSSDLFKSPEWRAAKADHAALLLIKKNADQLGVLSESDIDLLGKSLGTTDPTEVRDPSAGLKAARANMIENVNARVRSEVNLPKGRKLARWEPPPTPETHVDTPDETAAKEVLQDPSREWGGDRWHAETGLPVSDFISSDPRAQARVAQWRAETGGVLPSQRRTLEGWQADLQGGDPKKRDAAAAELANAANAAELPSIRAFAQQILHSNVAAGGGAGPLPIEGQR